MADDLKVSPIKIEILRVIALLSVGIKLFGMTELQLAEDYQDDLVLHQKLQSQLLSYNLILKIVNQLNSNCIEVRD